MKNLQLLRKGTDTSPCCGEKLKFEVRPHGLITNKVRYPATKESGNKEYYRAKCGSCQKNYTVEA